MSTIQHSKDWRVGHKGRDAMYYEELHDGEWVRLPIDGEMLIGKKHHVIYFGKIDDWSKGPQWTQGRRDQIIDRIKMQFSLDEYDYDGEAIYDQSEREFLIKIHGGLSSTCCQWSGCENQAIAGKVLCIDHCLPTNVWRPKAAEQGGQPDAYGAGYL